jgi:hypothetical protein
MPHSTRVLLLAGALGLLACAARAELPAVRDAGDREVRLESFFGARHRVLILVGLGTPAEAAMLDVVNGSLQALRRRRDTRLAVVFLGQSARQAGALCRQASYRFSWFADLGWTLAGPLAVDFLPALLVLSPGGEVVYRASALSEALVRAVVKHPERVPGPELQSGKAPLLGESAPGPGGVQ